MNEKALNGGNEQDHAVRKRRHGWWLGLLLGGLAGVLLGGAVVSTARVGAAPFGTGRFAHRGFGLQDPEVARERAMFVAEWMLRRVDASEDQQERVKQIVEGAIDRLAPLAEQHRSNREALANELGRPEIDREAIERIRTSELSLMDEASRTFTKSLADTADVLTPEQRAELLEMAARFHR